MVNELLFENWKKESLNNAQNDQMENVAGSVWLSLFMDGTGSASYRPRCDVL
jgi:hypothetical protein